jgi:hypothetical protein
MMIPRPQEHIHTDTQKYPDSIELGKAGSRMKVAFNADDPEKAMERIDQAFLIRGYAINELLKDIEREVKGAAKK